MGVRSLPWPCGPYVGPLSDDTDKLGALENISDCTVALCRNNVEGGGDTVSDAYRSVVFGV